MLTFFLHQTKWEPHLLTTKFIDSVGHTSFLEKPAEFSAILLEWARKECGRTLK
jgi:pimeloyl-ACP methyl ester carboxylesterase